MLYNLANYYSAAERFEDAVRALAEVVALDERTGHEDLASDRQALEQARMMAALSPEERIELRRQAEQAAKRLEAMSPEERAAAEDAARRAAIESLVQRVRDQALAALRGHEDSGRLSQGLLATAEQVAGDQSLGDEREDLATYLRAVAAILSGDSPPPVPTPYAPHIATLQSAVHRSEE
jgi:hypothetical protein